MITHELNRSGDSTIRPDAHEFEFSPERRAVMGEFLMDPDELVAELRSGANLARPELQFAMLGVLKCSLIGAGMGPVEAQTKAFSILHDGMNSTANSREIVLKLLTEKSDARYE